MTDNASDVNLNPDNLAETSFIATVADILDKLNKKITDNELEFTQYSSALAIVETSKTLYKELKEIELYTDVLIVKDLESEINSLISDIKSKLQNGLLNGIDGKSAYQIALDNGFIGTQNDWLTSLNGTDGKDGTNGKDGVNGTNGADGKDGVNGSNGADGKSAYQIALDNGFIGTQNDWLASLNGTDGKDGTNGKDGANGTNGADGKDGVNGSNGADGKSAYQIALDNGFIGTQNDWLTSLNGTDGKDGTNGKDGVNGTNGADGKDGVNGSNGADGKSAYQIALDNGFIGTQNDWLVSLNGTDGKDGTNGKDGVAGINGADGKDGVNGSNGADGKSAYQIALDNGFIGTQNDWLASLKDFENEDLNVDLLTTSSNRVLLNIGTIVANNRYVIDNPFGNDNYLDCDVRIEILIDNKWSDPSFTFYGSGRGVKAYSNLEGLVVQTGGNYLAYDSSLSGSGHGSNEAPNSASARLIVTYHGKIKEL